MLSFSHLWTKILCDFVEPQCPLSPFSLWRMFAEFFFFHRVFAIQFWHQWLCWQSVFLFILYIFALTQKVLYDSGWDAQGLPRKWLPADGMKKRNNKRVYVSLKGFPPVASFLFIVSGTGDADMLLSTVLQRWTKPPCPRSDEKEGIWVHLPAAKTPNLIRRHDRLWGLAPFSFSCRGPVNRLSRFYSYTKLPWPFFTCHHSVIFLFSVQRRLKKKRTQILAYSSTKRLRFGRWDWWASSVAII